MDVAIPIPTASRAGEKPLTPLGGPAVAPPPEGASPGPEAAERERSEFIFTVSHELKTPVASILYAARNLLRGVGGRLPDPAIHYVRVIDGECRRLSSTINDILDMRELESQALQIVRTQVHLARMVDRRCEVLRLQTDEKGLRVARRFDRRSGFVEGDPDRLERVVHNVLGNAIRFTPPGGEVTVAVARDPADAAQVVFTVEDSGIGIPAVALPRIAERYFRACPFGAGHGLGLSISKEIVRLHGGTLSIQSPPPHRDSGTLVTVRIPACSPPRILVMEDSGPRRALVGRPLASAGYAVVYADPEAEKEAEALRPDGIVINVQYGHRTVLRMRCSDALRDVPIVAVTGSECDPVTRRILADMGIQVLTGMPRKLRIVDAVEETILGRRGSRSPSGTEGRTPGRKP